MPAARVFFTIAALVCATSSSSAQDKAVVYNCEGSKIEPAVMKPSPIQLRLTMGPGNQVAVDGADIPAGTRFVSDNKIQFRFSNKDFTGEYFHYTGDLFLIFKNKHLAKLACKQV